MERRPRSKEIVSEPDVFEVARDTEEIEDLVVMNSEASNDNESLDQDEEIKDVKERLGLISPEDATEGGVSTETPDTNSKDSEKSAVSGAAGGEGKKEGGGHVTSGGGSHSGEEKATPRWMKPFKWLFWGLGAIFTLSLNAIIKTSDSVITKSTGAKGGSPPKASGGGGGHH